jgi:hypothetical protein
MSNEVIHKNPCQRRSYSDTKRKSWLGHSKSSARIEEVRMMDCLHHTAPDDEELLRFALDGEALSIEASRHLEECFSLDAKSSSKD